MDSNSIRRAFKLRKDKDKDIIDFLEEDSYNSGSISATCRNALKVYMRYKQAYGEFPLLDEFIQNDMPFNRIKFTHQAPQVNSAEPVASQAPVQTSQAPVSEPVSQPIQQSPTQETNSSDLLLGGAHDDSEAQRVKDALKNGFKGF